MNKLTVIRLLVLVLTITAGGQNADAGYVCSTNYESVNYYKVNYIGSQMVFSVCEYDNASLKNPPIYRKPLSSNICREFLIRDIGAYNQDINFIRNLNLGLNLANIFFGAGMYAGIGYPISLNAMSMIFLIKHSDFRPEAATLARSISASMGSTEHARQCQFIDLSDEVIYGIMNDFHLVALRGKLNDSNYYMYDEETAVRTNYKKLRN